jgi:PIN domain nuclease of toxin-antitoxin system
MKYLIDTHILIWHGESNPALKPSMLAILNNLQNEIFISHASLWEITIKVSLGKLKLGFPLASLEYVLLENGFTLLPFEFSHYQILSELPFHHNDPFDRMIISQALSEKLDIITHDDKFGLYSAPIIWA